jgi:hypothetical protein
MLSCQHSSNDPTANLLYNSSDGPVRHPLHIYMAYLIIGLLDGAIHVWAVLYRATRIKTLCMEGGHWNQGGIEQIVYKYRASPTVRSIDFIILIHHSQRSTLQVDTTDFTVKHSRSQASIDGLTNRGRTQSRTTAGWPKLRTELADDRMD